MRKVTTVAAGLAAVPVLALAAAPVFAGSPGQLAQGSGLYQVKNLTQKGSYASTISATCNDEIQYSMEIANTGFSALNNVTIEANVPTNGGASTATVTTDRGGNSGTHDTVTVNLSDKATQSLENGTTVLYDGNGNVIKTLPDTITSGVNIGTVDGSTTEYVNFKAKVNCPSTPPVTPPTTPPATPTTPAQPAQLVNTGPGEVVGIFGAVTIAGAAAYRWVLSRKLSRQ